MSTDLTDRVRRQGQALDNPAATEDAATAAQSVAGMLHLLAPELQRALPDTMSADRLTRLALTEIRKSPELLQCSHVSLAGAMLKATALALELGGTDECYLTPRRVKGQWECVLVVGYQGLIKLFYQHPLARSIDAHVVREGDDFDYGYGTSPFLAHRPALGAKGAPVAYYAVASLTTGANPFVVLDPDEVAALRSDRDGNVPASRIADPQNWMARKTAVRQLAKILPKSTSLSSVMAADGEAGSSFMTELRSSPAPAPAPAPRAVEAAPAPTERRRRPDPAPRVSTTEVGPVDTASGEVYAQAPEGASLDDEPAF